METIFDLAPAIVLFPLLSFLIALIFGRSLPKQGAIPGIIASGLALGLSIWAFAAVATGATYNEDIYTWVAAEDVFTLTFGILIDQLSALMLVIVALIAFLVHVYSLGYMNHDEYHRSRGGLPRYYAGLGLFTFSMLAFVFANNLLMAFIFFELVGFCSYLLIGFWWREDAPASAAKKAFIVTRFGDYFFLVGLVAVFATFGTAAFVGPESFPQIAQEVIAGERAVDAVETFGFSPQTWFTIIGLLILGGVLGKSAQFPLHTWLPDAMEGPTPISALIHAATMVAAGVYLVARIFGFYAISPTALAVIAFVGAFTALFAATMGVVKDDIKQVLAYSTISQYGFMMVALGVGGYVAGTFHLMNHAYFKALLFLGAGAVILMAGHKRDMWELGGLKAHAPVTYWSFLIGALALAGIIPFSGFWSKDELLYDALAVGLETPIFLVVYALALTAVFFTGLYTFRMVFLTFHGTPRSEAAKEPDSVGWSVKLPLVVLGVLAAGAGLVNMVPVQKLLDVDVAFLSQWLDGPLEETAQSTYADLVAREFPAAEPTVLLPALLALGLAIAGALVAYWLYGSEEVTKARDPSGAIATLIRHNYYQDELQVWLAAGLTSQIARASDVFDQSVIDGAVDGTATVSLFSSERLRRVQTGIVSNYVVVLLAGLLTLLAIFGIYGGWF